MFSLHAKLRFVKIYWNYKLQTTCFYLTQSFFIKQKRSGTNLPASFSAWFLKKNIYLVIFYYLTKFCWMVAITSWDIGQYMYCNCSLTTLSVRKMSVRKIRVRHWTWQKLWVNWPSAVRPRYISSYLPISHCHVVPNLGLSRFFICSWHQHKISSITHHASQKGNRKKKIFAHSRNTFVNLKAKIYFNLMYGALKLFPNKN